MTLLGFTIVLIGLLILAQFVVLASHARLFRNPYGL